MWFALKNFIFSLVQSPLGGNESENFHPTGYNLVFLLIANNRWDLAGQYSPRAVLRFLRLCYEAVHAPLTPQLYCCSSSSYQVPSSRDIDPPELYRTLASFRRVQSPFHSVKVLTDQQTTGGGVERRVVCQPVDVNYRFLHVLSTWSTTTK